MGTRDGGGEGRGGGRERESCPRLLALVAVEGRAAAAALCTTAGPVWNRNVDGWLVATSFLASNLTAAAAARDVCRRMGIHLKKIISTYVWLLLHEKMNMHD